MRITPKWGRSGNTRLPVYLLTLILFIATSHVAADSPDILIVASSDAAIYQKFQDAYRKAYTDSGSAKDNALQQTIYLEGKHIERNQVTHGTQLIITIGSRAARAIAALSLDIPVLNTVLPESVFLSLAYENETCSKSSAVYIDQPISRQGYLAELIFPFKKEYGLLLGPVSIRRQPEIDLFRQVTQRQLTVMAVDRDESTMAAGRKLLSRTDLFLAINDPVVLNRENAKWLLYVAYQKRLPVIGFSRAYVKAGAAAAVFSELDQMAGQAAEITYQWRKSNSNCLPEPQYPHDFRVAINRAVIQSLGGIIENEDKLAELILEKEQH